MNTNLILLLFNLIYLSFCINSQNEWILSESEKEQFKKESELLKKTNKNLYNILTNSNNENNNNPNLFLSRYTYCQKCQLFTKKLRNIRDKYGYELFYKAVESKLCVLLKVLKIDVDVCKGFVKGYLPIVTESIFSKYINDLSFCGKIKLCESTDSKSYINVDDYAKNILKNKPKRQKEKPDLLSKKWRMLQITDLHLDLLYKKNVTAECDKPLCCRENSTKKKNVKLSGKYGFEGKCDINDDLFKSFVEDAYKRNVDFIIWTGDNAPHDTWEGSQDLVYEASKDLKRMLDEKFRNGDKKIPIYYVLGNHEKYPNDAFKEEEPELLKQMADIYKDYLDDNAYETFSKYGYYSMMHPDSNLKIIAINCFYCDSFNFNNFNSTKINAKKMFDWLEKELDNSEKNNEYVFILNHFPLNSGFTLTQCAQRFQALFDRYDYIVRGIFSGHTHRDDVEIISEYFNKKSYINLNFIAPPITTYSHKLPSYRIYEVDSNYKRVIDYEQYRFNLTKSNIEEKPYWYLAHNATNLFKVDDITEYDKIIKIENISEYVLKEFSDSNEGIEKMNIISRHEEARCIMTTNNFDEYYKCLAPKLGLNENLVGLISNYLYGEFEEDL